MAFAALPDLMAILMAGTSDKDLLQVLLVVQDAMVWFMNRRLLDIKYRDYEDLVFLGTYNIRRLAVARALHYARLPDDRNYELSTKTRFSYALDFNNKAETDLKYIGNGMLQIALLYPAIRLARAPVTDEESPEYLEFVAEYPERMKGEQLWKLGAVALPHVMNSTTVESGNDRGRLYAQTSLMWLSGQHHSTYAPLLTSQDIFDIGTVQVSFLKYHRNEEIELPRYGIRWILDIHTTDYRQDWQFSSAAIHANTTLSVSIAFEVLALAEEQPHIVSQLDGHQENYKNESLSWQSSHHRPTILYTIQNTTLAQEYLRYIVRFESSGYWRQKEGRHNMLVFTEVMERLTGITFKNEEHRYNPKAWLKVLKMKPDFSMLDVK